MARTGAPFFCTSCGAETLKWEGRCPSCGEWNALAEAPRRSSPRDARSARSGAGGRRTGEPAPLREAAATEEERRPVDLGELDRVLGGGLVPGSLLLLGGAPGIGKSTLLLQLAARLAAAGRDVLYVSGEESAAQVRMRAARLGDGAEEVPFLAATDVAAVVERARERELALLCVDSVQTLQAPEVDGSPGGVAQVRACAAHLQEYAKESGAAAFLIGHVTKQGGLAGPRTLEHLVDTVLTFEGQRTLEHRILRATKNRFGGVDEMAVFRMTSGGLQPVARPAELFLADRPTGLSGSAVAVPLQGSRPLPAEVQALTALCRYGNPRRVTTGFPSRRLAVLLAVLERRAGLSLGDADVFVNVVGGLRLSDPAADLAVLAALASAELDVPVPERSAFAGEVGLGGEVRSVARVEQRAREAARAGLEVLWAPDGSEEAAGAGLTVRTVASVQEMVERIREGP